MKISQFEVLNHGVEHEQYFQGAGVSFTKWDTIQTGFGLTPLAALEDTLEIMAQMGHEIDKEEEERIKSELAKDDTRAVHSDTFCYLSIRYMLAKSNQTA